MEICPVRPVMFNLTLEKKNRAKASDRPGRKFVLRKCSFNINWHKYNYNSVIEYDGTF